MMYSVYKFQSGDCVGRSCFLLCPQSFELTVGRHTWLEAISRSCQPCSSQGRRGMPQTSTVSGGISSGSGHGRDAPPFVDDVVLSETWVPYQKLPFQGIYLPFSVEPMFSFGTGNSFRVSLDLHIDYSQWIYLHHQSRYQPQRRTY